MYMYTQTYIHTTQVHFCTCITLAHLLSHELEVVLRRHSGPPPLEPVLVLLSLPCLGRGQGAAFGCHLHEGQSQHIVTRSAAPFNYIAVVASDYAPTKHMYVHTCIMYMYTCMCHVYHNTHSTMSQLLVNTYMLVYTCYMTVYCGMLLCMHTCMMNM